MAQWSRAATQGAAASFGPEQPSAAPPGPSRTQERPVRPSPAAQPVKLVQDPGAAALQQLLRVERDARQVGSERELACLIANETRKLVNARQVFVVRVDRTRFRTEAVSSLTSVDRDAPAIRWIEQLLHRLASTTGDTQRHTFTLPTYCEAGQDDYKTYPFAEMQWLPLRTRDGRTFAGMLLARERPWSTSDEAVASRLGETFSHAWQALVRPGALKPRSYRGRLLAAAAIMSVVAAGFIPVPMSSLAPAEVVPDRPFIVAAPIEGTIADILVEPNAVVAEGDILFRFSDTQTRNALEIAEREVQVAEAKWRQVTQAAFADPQAKRELAIVQAEFALKQAERDYARDMQAKSVVRAPRAGIAEFSDKREFIGRPVAIGQKILEIADPARVELQLNVPVEDSAMLHTGAAVRVFLDTDPLHPVDGVVTRASHGARPTESNQLAFRALAALSPGQGALPRLGIRGTAQLFGADVPLYFYLFRRPISFVRQRIGL